MLIAPTLKTRNDKIFCSPILIWQNKKNCCFVAWFMKCCTMPNGLCWGTSWGMLEYKRWCWLREKGQTDIVTHSANIWNKVIEVSTASKGSFHKRSPVIIKRSTFVFAKQLPSINMPIVKAIKLILSMLNVLWTNKPECFWRGNTTLDKSQKGTQ